MNAVITTTTGSKVIISDEDLCKYGEQIAEEELIATEDAWTPCSSLLKVTHKVVEDEEDGSIELVQITE